MAKQRSSRKHVEADGYPQRAIQGVFEDFTALTQTLRVFKEMGDASATGLLRQVVNVKFLGTVYLLKQVLPALTLEHIISRWKCIFRSN